MSGWNIYARMTVNSDSGVWAAKSRESFFGPFMSAGLTREANSA
jgi:hypothetical protein